MTFLLSFCIMLFLGYFVWNFFSRRWQEVYISQDIEEFMSVSGALQSAGIRFKTTTWGQEFNGRGKVQQDLPAVSYNIVVLENKVHAAQEIINQVKFNLK